MAIDPPWRLDPQDNIVGVGWTGGKFAVLTFNSVWRNGAPNGNNFDVEVPPLTTVPIYGNVSYKLTPGGPLLISSTEPYHSESVVGQPATSATVTYHRVSLSMTWPNGDNAAADQWVRELTIDGVTTWTTFGSLIYNDDPHTGVPTGPSFDTFTDWLNGWSLESELATVGPEVVTSPATTSYTDTDNAVLIFNLSAIRAALGKEVTSLTIGFDTGAGPSSVHDPDHVGIIGYVWTAALATFNHAKADAFTVDAQNMPIGAWPAAASSQVFTSPQVQPTPSQHVAFRIDLDTLAVTII